MKKYHGVEGHGDLLRDPETNSIINSNSIEYEQYVARRDVKRKKSEKVETIEDEVANIKSDINEIKSLLKELLNGS